MKTARYFQYGDASVLRIDDVDALGSLRRRVSGAVLTAADAEYDDARAAFQTARSHSPAVLVACRVFSVYHNHRLPGTRGPLSPGTTRGTLPSYAPAAGRRPRGRFLAIVLAVAAAT